MKVFWVLGWDQYYPRRDNFLASFDNEKDARQFIYEQGDYWDNYEVINISHRL
jgi:hypothetical protein